MKTPEEFKRENIKELFDKILSAQKIKLEPSTISVGESWQSDFTSVDFSYKVIKGDTVNLVETQETEAKGFVDGVFRACCRIFEKDYPTLSNIKLYDYKVKPNFTKAKTHSGSDAKVEVTVMMEVKDHGIAEFSSVSRSILYSSFEAVLKVFQFYANCEIAFHKLQLILEDARQRNRGDIVQSCVLDLSKITEVNTYEKE